MKHNRTLRRGLGILLSLVLCLSLLPATALAADPEPATETADFTTNATAALALLGGTEKAEWDSDTSTLTLKGVNFTTTADTAVQLPDGATIVLAEGTTNIIASNYEGNDSSYGIYAAGSLTIQGSGTLTVTGGDVPYEYSGSYGIYADKSVTIKGGTVTAKGGDATNGSYGIYTSYNVTVSGTAKVTATGGTADNSTGIYVYEYYDNDSKGARTKSWTFNHFSHN